MGADLKKEFVEHGLHVNYRGSDELQFLDIVVETESSSPVRAGTIYMMQAFAHVLHGGAGGSEFPPDSGIVKHLGGPLTLDSIQGTGPRFEWSWQVASVSPKYLRVLIDGLSFTGYPTAVKTMNISGSLSLDNTSLSIHTANIKQWLNETDTYPGLWSKLDFTWEEQGRASGFVLRVRFKDPVSEKVFPKLEHYIAIWTHEVSVYQNWKGTGIGMMDSVPQSGYSQKEVTFHFPVFHFRREPARNLLLNMLQCFHKKVAPIQNVIIGMG